MIYFTLYSRSYCHLCDDMRDALHKFVENISHQILIIDVDQDPELLKLYDELVPILFARKSGGMSAEDVGRELCHYFLDEKKVKAFLDE